MSARRAEGQEPEGTAVDKESSPWLMVAEAGDEAEKERMGAARGRSWTRDDDAMGWTRAARSESWPNDAESAERAPRTSMVWWSARGVF